MEPIQETLGVSDVEEIIDHKPSVNKKGTPAVEPIEPEKEHKEALP
jgi:hypothetical protein